MPMKVLTLITLILLPSTCLANSSVNLFGGWTPIHTSDIKHDFAAGFGFGLKAKFGQSPMQTSNDVIRQGL